jgi:hypothetical protein
MAVPAHPISAYIKEVRLKHECAQQLCSYLAFVLKTGILVQDKMLVVICSSKECHGKLAKTGACMFQ